MLTDRQSLAKRFLGWASVACLLLAVTGCPREDYGDWPESAIRRSLSTGTSKPLFVVRVGGLAGLIDIGGQLIVTLQFDNVERFTDGLAAALKNGRWGYIDENGTWVIEPRFAYAGQFSENRAVVTLTQGGKCGYIDKQGNVVISPKFDCPGVFIGGVARVGTRSLGSHVTSRFADVGMTCDYWFIDDTGSPVGRPSRDFLRKRLGTTRSDKFQVTIFERDGAFGLKDNDGREILEAQFAYIGPFKRGLAVVTLEGGKVGYVNPKGKIVWKPTK